jgi:hypothetical protein
MYKTLFAMNMYTKVNLQNSEIETEFNFRAFETEVGYNSIKVKFSQFLSEFRVLQKAEV